MDMKPAPGIDHVEPFSLDFNDVSIESLGAHVLFGDVTEISMKDAAIFVLKANQIFSPSREITLFLNTLGGSCYDAFALIDLMEVSKLPIKTVGLGNIVSMGVLLLCAGTKGRRILTRNTQVMAHQFSGGIAGAKFHELMADYKAELYLKHQFIEHFKRHTTMDEKQIEDVLFGASDRLLTPIECKKYGLVDQVVDELPDFGITVPDVQPKRARGRVSGSKRRSRK